MANRLLKKINNKMNTMTKEQFQEEIRLGIPDTLPEAMPYDKDINHAPKRKDILTPEEKRLALRNALRYFPKHLHEQLAPEFMEELHEYGRIYMYRYRPRYEMHARPISDYPHKSEQAAAIMLMIQNNLDSAVAQHPHELIIYGGNGAIFQNWAQYRLAMKYLSEMTDEQCILVIRWACSLHTRMRQEWLLQTVWLFLTIRSQTTGSA